MANELITACQLAWQTDLMRGFSGNASIHLASGNILITASGVAKGRLGEADLIEVDPSGKIIGGNRKPSIELGLHLALYAAFPACRAVLHTHPVWLQALALMPEPSAPLLDLRLHEADYWRERLAIAPEFPPGSPGLGPAAAKAIQKLWAGSEALLPCAVWLTGHGLCALGENMDAALGISEQLEHLAHIQWAVCAKA